MVSATLSSYELWLIVFFFYIILSVLVFKVFSIGEEEFVENYNLRVGKNLNLNFSCNDVAWNPMEGKNTS